MLMDTSNLTIAGVQPSNAVKIQTICYCFSSWYFMVDTHNLTIMGVQSESERNISIWIWGSRNTHLCQVQISCPLWLWNPEEMSPEIQNRGISGPIKRKKEKNVSVSVQPSCVSGSSEATQTIIQKRHFSCGTGRNKGPAHVKQDYY